MHADLGSALLGSLAGIGDKFIGARGRQPLSWGRRARADLGSALLGSLAGIGDKFVCSLAGIGDKFIGARRAPDY